MGRTGKVPAGSGGTSRSCRCGKSRASCRRAPTGRGRARWRKTAAPSGRREKARASIRRRTGRWRRPAAIFSGASRRRRRGECRRCAGRRENWGGSLVGCLIGIPNPVWQYSRGRSICRKTKGWHSRQLADGDQSGFEQVGADPDQQVVEAGGRRVGAEDLVGVAVFLFLDAPFRIFAAVRTIGS